VVLMIVLNKTLTFNLKLCYNIKIFFGGYPYVA